MNFNIKNNSGQQAYIAIFGIMSLTPMMEDLEVFGDEETLSDLGMEGDNMTFERVYSQANQVIQKWGIYNNGMFLPCYSGQNIQDCLCLVGSGDSMDIKNVPMLSSGVILISYGKKPVHFEVVVNVDGVVTISPPDFKPGTLDEDTVFNMVEFTHDGNGLNVDTTNVDFYSTPVTINLVGKDSGHNPYNATAGAMKYDRHDIFEKYDSETVGTQFNKLLMKDGSGNYVRILGPQHGVDSGYISACTYDSYVEKCWNKYKTEVLTVVTNTNTYFGMVNESDEFCFSAATASTVALYTVQKPAPDLATDIFGCNGTLSAPNNEYGAIVARVGAALNRTILHSKTTQPDCNSLDFYDDTKYPTNVYAKVLHECYLGGNGYAFPFDDVCGYSSDIGCYYPATLNVTLDQF